MSTGFLLTNLSGKLKLMINELTNQQVFKKLYIYVFVDKHQKNLKNNDWVSQKIVDLYSTSFQLFPNLDVRIILDDLKLQDKSLNKFMDYNFDVMLIPKNCDTEKLSNFKSLKKNLPVIYINVVQDNENNICKNDGKVYQNVVLGGTFDRLHTGHKILLTEALIRCSKKLTVGVTDDDIIKGKKLWELIEPCSQRIEAVETFIKEVDSSIDFEVIPISDIYGPTKSDPNFNMIVVSSETLKGGLKVNELRIQKGLNKLDIFVVNLAKDFQSNDMEEEKISSSNSRMRLLGTYIKIPEPKPELPCKPYIIGLTGGIASGKSSISQYLKTLGAAVIDCDEIGHHLYKPGTKIYFELIKLFGNNIVSQNGEINRRELGSIVFSCPEKLEILNNLMWPAIINKSLEECKRLYIAEKKEIVFLEAAVLLKAGWHKKVHEVWSVMVPQNEAVERLKKRNNLTEEEAKSRIEAQPSNAEVVKNSNVVFCSLWSYEFTRQQVEKAWKAVQIHLNHTVTI